MADFARSDDPAVQAQLDRLALLSPPGDRLGLDRIAALLDRLGNPHQAMPPVFHVAGTNGKGSVCAFLRAALEPQGHRVHAFTSPHLVRFNERIRIAGRLIEDRRLAELLEEVLDAAQGIGPSFFEATTAAAMLAFARTPADATILEVGLGGRLDATNVVDRPLACGIAGLGFDHAQFLGRRIGQIAAEKAGIAKAGVPLLTQRYHPAAARSIAGAAQSSGAIWLPRGGQWKAAIRGDALSYSDRWGQLRLPLPTLPGRHQAMNAALAVAMLRHQSRIEIDSEALAEGIQSARWPARMQRLGDGALVRRLPEGSSLWVDGGHNPSAARSIAAECRSRLTSDEPFVLLFASLTSKEPSRTLAPFRNVADRVVTLPIAGHDCYTPEALADIAASLGFEARSAVSLGEAMAAITEPSTVLLFGSLYLAGDALRANGELPD